MNLRPFRTRRPLSIRAAAARSVSRPFVHVPRKTWSISTSVQSATSTTLSTRSGLATFGSRSDASTSTPCAYDASSSVETPSLEAKPKEAYHDLVTESNGKTPNFAPISTAIFDMVILPSMPIEGTPSPENSTDIYVAPSAPTSPITLSARSLALTPRSKEPEMLTVIVSGTLNQSLPVCAAAATSAEPRPVEQALSAPYVHVCESAPTTRSPGITRPDSGTTWWHTPSPTSCMSMECARENSRIELCILDTSAEGLGELWSRTTAAPFDVLGPTNPSFVSSCIISLLVPS